MVDVRLDTQPQDQLWSQVGSRLMCKQCGTVRNSHRLSLD
jgi:hypothetical protein